MKLDFHTKVMARTGLEPHFNKQDAIDRIIEVVCSHFDMRYEKIRSRRRLKELVVARQTLSFCLRYGVNQYGYSSITYREVGELVGNRDHATVLHSIKEVERRYVTDKNYRTIFINIAANLFSDALEREIQRLNKQIII